MIDEKSIPQKSIFKSSEVCEIVGVKPYILRFWETEFVEICPIVSSSGKKLFEKKDILLISIIKDLLFSKKLTLEKAKFEISKIDIEKVLVEESAERILEKDASNDLSCEHSCEQINHEGDERTESDIEPDDLIELIPEIPSTPSIANLNDIQAENGEKKVLSEQALTEYKPAITEENLVELNVALETIFEKSKSLKGFYNWV